MSCRCCCDKNVKRERAPPTTLGLAAVADSSTTDDYSGGQLASDGRARARNNFNQ